MNNVILQKTQQNLKQVVLFYKNHRDRKKSHGEIPKLIDFLISYISAGIHPYKALEFIVQKNNFSKFIRFPLFKIVILCARGCSFIESLEIVLKEIISNPSYKYLSLLLIGLKISFVKGAGSVNILEKIKEKVEDQIQFQRKLLVLTAQMRLQANVILFSPLCLAGIIYLIAPAHITIFLNTFFGNVLFLLMIFFNLCGYFTLKNLIKI